MYNANINTTIRFGRGMAARMLDACRAAFFVLVDFLGFSEVGLCVRTKLFGVLRLQLLGYSGREWFSAGGAAGG